MRAETPSHLSRTPRSDTHESTWAAPPASPPHPPCPDDSSSRYRRSADKDNPQGVPPHARQPRHTQHHLGRLRLLATTPRAARVDGLQQAVLAKQDKRGCYSLCIYSFCILLRCMVVVTEQVGTTSHRLNPLPQGLRAAPVVVRALNKVENATRGACGGAVNEHTVATLLGRSDTDKQ